MHWSSAVAGLLAAAGVDVAGADFVLGTSAGSVVATQLATEAQVAELTGRTAQV